jgi:hypothetical protein
VSTTSERVTETARGVDLGYVTFSRRVLYVQGALISVVALFGFVLGYYVGRSQAEPIVVSHTPEKVLITGRVIYENSLGQKLPDGGAVVLAMSSGRRVPRAERPSLVGLGPANPPLDDNDPVITTIRNLGGAYARADEQGRIELTLRPGEYFVLWVSRGATRSASAIPRSEDLNTLGALVRDADQLIGEQRYVLASVELDSGATVDREFEAAP